MLRSCKYLCWEKCSYLKLLKFKSFKQHFYLVETFTKKKKKLKKHSLLILIDE